MAPLIPPRKTSRPHTIEERPAKRQRVSRPESGAIASHRDSEVSARENIATRNEVEESSDDDEGEVRRSKQAYGSLLGALKASEPQRRTTIRDVRDADGEDDSSQRDLMKNQQTSPLQDDEGSGDTEVDQVNERDEHELVPDDEGDSDNEDLADPFEAHFANPDMDDLKTRLESLQAGRLSNRKDVSDKGLVRRVTIEPYVSEPDSRMSRRPTLTRLPLKQRLRDRGSKALSKAGRTAQLASTVFNYEDLLFGARSTSNADALRSLASLHVLNHVLKTRDRLVKNTARLARDSDAATEFRDQGFTRPKVLILLETRQMCVRYIKAITSLFAPEQQENRKRFEDAFEAPEDKFGNDKPEGFRELFEGNDDNEFRIGIKFTRKTIKFYSQFYASDIILASPLGLRRVLDASDPKKRDSDFLSSIEVFIIDQADAMLMQNFSHVEAVFEALNGQPKEAHGCDFSRVRQWYLDGHAKYLRQTIIFSAFIVPELNGIFAKHMLDVAGKTKITPDYSGAIQNLSLSQPIKQTFARFACRAPDKDPDERFAYFTKTIIPSLNRQQQLLLPRQSTSDTDTDPQQRPGLGALIFIPSYLDFVRVRNYFSTSQSTSNLTFGNISEYTSHSDTLRARSYFLTGKMSVLLYTGRAHHFHRYRLRGVKRVVFYGVPENPAFWGEVLEMLSRTVDEGNVGLEEQGVGARCLFSRFDGLALERVVGSKRVGRMVKEGVEDVFEFM